MKIKLLREVLVGGAAVAPTLRGTVVEMDDNEAKEYIAAGLAEEDGGKAKASASAPKNKMAPAVDNKEASAPESDENRDNFEREPVRDDEKPAKTKSKK